MPRISVIIPCYQRLATAKRAVSSVLSQTVPPIEVILVDDGSSPPITIDDLGICDPRLRVLRLEENSGAAAARNLGVEVATGDTLAFLDSDDEWLPGKLAAQLPRLTADGPIAVACGWIAHYEDGRQSEKRIPRASREQSDFASGCWFSPGSTLVVPRASFDAVGPFHPKLRRLEDYDWFLRFALIGGRLDVAPEIGARISVGRRSTVAAVEGARAIIGPWLNRTNHPLVDRHFRRASSAYLALELAIAARNEGRGLLLASQLFQSLAIKPRLEPHLAAWWVERSLADAERSKKRPSVNESQPPIRNAL